MPAYPPRWTLGGAKMTSASDARDGSGSMRPPGSQPILNYATTPRYDDLPIPGDPLRTARKGTEAVFGYAAYDRYKTTNSVAAPRTQNEP